MPQGWIFLPLGAVIHGNKGKSGFQPMAACLFVISRTSARLINVPPLPLPPGSVFAPSSGVKLISNSRRAARRRGALRPRAEIIVLISMAASGFSVGGRARNRVLDPPLPPPSIGGDMVASVAGRCPEPLCLRWRIRNNAAAPAFYQDP